MESLKQVLGIWVANAPIHPMSRSAPVLQAMLAGNKVNNTEQRAVWHMMLRKTDVSGLTLDGDDIGAAIADCRSRMTARINTSQARRSISTTCPSRPAGCRSCWCCHHSKASASMAAGRARPALPRLDCARGLGRAQRQPADLHSAVCADGRAAAALGHCRPHVRRARRVAGPAAGWPAAHQHRLQRAVCRHLGFVGGHRRHRGHGGPALAAAPGLLHARLAGLAGRRRHPGHPDPAVDQHDHLRRHDQHLGGSALRGRRDPGPAAHRVRQGGW